MWACAYGRSVVESGAAGGDPTRIASYEVSFLGMVFPGTELFVQLIHTVRKTVLLSLLQNE